MLYHRGVSHGMCVYLRVWEMCLMLYKMLHQFLPHSISAVMWVRGPDQATTTVESELEQSGGLATWR